MSVGVVIFSTTIPTWAMARERLISWGTLRLSPTPGMLTMPSRARDSGGAGIFAPAPVLIRAFIIIYPSTVRILTGKRFFFDIRVERCGRRCQREVRWHSHTLHRRRPQYRCFDRQL